METAMDRLQRHEEKIKEASHRILAISSEMQLGERCNRDYKKESVQLGHSPAHYP